MKDCRLCPHFVECWEEYSDYCYRDREYLNELKGND